MPWITIRWTGSRQVRARILFLSSASEQREALRLAQEALSSVAIAFGHSFIMREALFEHPDLASTLPEHHACVFSGSREHAQALASMMNCSHGYSVLNERWPEDLFRIRYGHAPEALIAWPLQQNQPSYATAAMDFLTKVKGSELGDKAIQIAEDGGKAYLEALNKAALFNALPPVQAMALDQAMDTLLNVPNQRLAIFADLHEAGLLSRLIAYLGGYESAVFETFNSPLNSLQFCPLLPGRQKPGLFSMLLAMCDLLANSLNLENEAECLSSAIHNVLNSGWRSQDLPGITSYLSDGEIMDLIDRQVSLAGELLQRQREE